MICHCNVCGIIVEAPNPSLALCSLCNVKMNHEREDREKKELEDKEREE